MFRMDSKQQLPQGGGGSEDPSLNLRAIAIRIRLILATSEGNSIALNLGISYPQLFKYRSTIF